MVNVQTCPETPGHPLQPPNVAPVAGVAVTFTVIPFGTAVVHDGCELAQFIPGGLIVTVPAPVPWKVIVMLGPEPPLPPLPEPVKQTTFPVI